MNRQTSSGLASVRQLCQAFALSRQAFYAARRQPQPTPRRGALSQVALPRGRPATSVSALEPRIRELARQNPAWGVRKIWACLRREGLIASHKRVWALMKAWGLVLAPANAEHRVPALRGHVAVEGSNRRWATDLTTTWTQQDGWVAIALLVDCGDRFLLDAEATKSQDSRAVLAPLERALESCFHHPLRTPDGLELRTDHGPQYTGADCHALCHKWRIDHTFAPVARPTGNAVAERLILTLKQELIWTQDWISLQQLQAALSTWKAFYNEQRPHQALNWRTPAEARENKPLHQLQLAA